MAQTIGQHGVAAFTSPVNGELLNATVVLSNDNTTRSAYVDHDIDSGIHVQSSLLAARPAAGTAGRKWMTTDTGDVNLWFDTGAAWEEIAYVPSVGGNAATATALQTPRNINGVAFDGTANITVTAAAGTVTGATLASNVLASSLTSVGTLSGLTVTAPITGSVTGSSGSTTGNAATATALQTARNINGVAFDGTANITLPTVAADASTLTGTTLASGVTASSLTSVGTLTALTTSGTTSLATSAGALSVRSVAYTFPASQGAASTLLTNDGSGTLTWATAAGGGFTLGTPVASTTGTSIDFTGIPATAKQIVVSFKEVSHATGPTWILIQIGDSGGIETTGYISCGAYFSGSSQGIVDVTNGFMVYSFDGNSILTGMTVLTLENQTTNSWSCTGVTARTSVNFMTLTAGGKSLSATLDRVRITTSSGTANFDAGEINIAYI